MRQAIQKPPDRPVYHLPALSGPGWPQYLQGVKDWWRGDTGSEPGETVRYIQISRTTIEIEIILVRDVEFMYKYQTVLPRFNKRFCECLEEQSRLSAITQHN